MIPGCQNIIFDLDGTLTNPVEGILNSLRYSLKQMNYFDLPESLPVEFVGPPLQQGFKNIFGLNEMETEKAVRLFREYYGSHGLYENHPFEGIGELLEELSIQGKRIFVATSKLEKFAQEIIRHFEFDRYIADIKGADYAGEHTKSELIQALIEKYRLNPEETIMVGDTLFDIEGARDSGIKCVAVGYGFNGIETLKQASPDYLAGDVEELFELFCS
jgi:phosphoglycolate phosphatase